VTEATATLTVTPGEAVALYLGLAQLVGPSAGVPLEVEPYIDPAIGKLTNAIADALELKRPYADDGAGAADPEALDVLGEKMKEHGLVPS
jgi:hypothetical protein